MINIILQSALFGLTLTFGVYLLMSALNRRTGSAAPQSCAASPLLPLWQCCWCSIFPCRTI